MIRCLLLASFAAAALSVPAPASAAEDEPVIREIDVRPAAPVVGAEDSVRLVIDVVARGVRGRHGVVVEVEPGAPPGPVLDSRRPVRPPAADEREEGRFPQDGPGEPKSSGSIAATMASRLVTDGWQTWRFLPDKRLNRFYPAGTWTVTVTARGEGGAERTEYASFQLRRETRLAAVKAERDGAGVRVSGRLKRLDPRGYAGFLPFREQRVEILWRRDASDGWERAAEAVTDGQGGFSRIVPGREDGEWRVRYPGNGQQAEDDSKIHQL
jgi:hypothetical protein